MNNVSVLTYKNMLSQITVNKAILNVKNMSQIISILNQDMFNVPTEI